MFNSIISDFILEPLTQLFAGLYTAIQIFIPNYGFAIVVLSIVTALIMIPIERKVRGSVLKEKTIENVLAPQIINIKKNYKGAEQTLAIKRLYSRYSYSPFYAIRNIYSILLQLPFLIGAYLMLSENQDIQGQSFLFLKDLSCEDKLMAGFNLMPLLMTAVNILTLYFLHLSKKENYQAIGVAIFFCVLLYKAPSALLLYWTMNNVIHLIRAIYKKYLKNKVENLYIYSKHICPKIHDYILSTKTFTLFKENFFDKPEQEFFKKSWKGYVYLILVSPLVITSFNNIGPYSLEEIFSSIFIVLMISSVFILFLSIIKGFIKSSPLLRIAFIYGLIVIGSAYFYKTLVFNLLGNFEKNIRICITLAVFIFIFQIGKFKLLNQIIALFLIIFTGSCFYENHVAKNEFLSGIKQQSIQLNSKPNIYYFLCESMNSTDIAVKTYGLSVEEKESFEKYLKAHDFAIPDSLYTNGNNTLMTLQTIFLMTDYIGGSVGNLDATLSGRLMITGGKENTLLKILKDNDYHTTEALGDAYFGTTKGPLLDYYDSQSNNKELAPIIDSNVYFSNIINRLKLYNGTSLLYKTPTEFFKDYFKNEPKTPHFLFYRLAHTYHTRSDVNRLDKKDREDWVNSGIYRKAYEKEIQELKNLTDMILKHDPDAIIVMCGDHGSWLYRYQTKSVAELKEFLKEANISYEDFIDDKYKVFAAIRLPDKYGKIEELWSPGNIFAKLFTKIGYTGDRLNISNNFSYYHDVEFVDKKTPIIKEGNILNLPNE